MTELNVIALNLKSPEILFFQNYFNNCNLMTSFVSVDCDHDLKTLVKAGRINIVIVDFDFKYYRVFEFIEICLLQEVVIVAMANSTDVIDFNLKKIHLLPRPISAKKIAIVLACIIENFEAKLVEIEMNAAYDKNVLCIPSLDRVDLVKIEDIICCAADGNYTTFYLKNGHNVISSKNIGQFEKKLGYGFIRVHHSYLVNGKHVVSFTKKNGVLCELSNSMVVPVSKRKQGHFNSYFSQNSLR